MNPIDIAYLAVMAYGFYKGMTQGFIGSILAFGKFILGILIALRFSAALSAVLQKVFMISSVYAPLLSFIVMLVGTMGVLFILSSALELFVKAAHLGSLNRSLGIVLWAFLLTLGFSTLLTLGEKGGLLPPNIVAESKVYPYVIPVANVVYCKMGDVVPALSTIADSFKLLTEDIARAAMGECLQ